MGFFDKIKAGLAKTRSNMSAAFNSALADFTGENDEVFEELEEMLIMADAGVDTSCAMVEKLRVIVRERGLRGGEELRAALQEVLTEAMDAGDNTLKLETKPSVILMVGVNGVGKPPPSASWPPVLPPKERTFCCVPVIPSVPLPPSSWKCGLSAPTVTLSAMKRAVTPLPSYLTASPLPRPGTRISSLWIPPVAFTISRT